MMNTSSRLLLALALIGSMSSVHAADNDPKFGILCYHNIVDDSAPLMISNSKQHDGLTGEIERQYFPGTISAAKMLEHFNWLKNNGYTPVSWQQVLDARAGRTALPDKPVLLTFDDGYESFYQTVYPLLKAYRYPAVLAVVTSWLNTPADGQINYGNQKLPRSYFITWQQAREMSDSGLVEIASHSHDLHHSITGNSFGSLFAAALPGKYENGRYETLQEYKARLKSDLTQSAQIIAQNTGRRPRILVWPYGQFNQTAVNIAREVGLDSDFTLSDRHLNQPSSHHMGRILLEQGTDYDTLKTYLDEKIFVPDAHRTVQIDLDYVYDANPAQTNRNIDKLLERINKLGANTVYLQAFADEDGNGVAEAAYFPNRHLKMKADLFSRVAWQLMTRNRVQVYAWMPMMAMDLGSHYDYVKDTRTGSPSKQHYLRLSPYSAKSRQAAAEVFEDLAFSSRFNGILFHDDGFLTDFEQTSRSANDKTNDLIEYSDQLKAAALQYSFNGQDMLKTARNLYASVITDPNATQWFAQSLPKFTDHYDYTAIMAMPYMENEQAINSKTAQNWLGDLVSKVKDSGVPMKKVVFELQTQNWHTKKPIHTNELATWMQSLKNASIPNYGYYPDDFLNNQPDAAQIRPVFSDAR